MQLARNVVCEQLTKEAQDKLAHAKHEIACELVAKQADIQRLKSELQEFKAKHGEDDASLCIKASSPVAQTHAKSAIFPTLHADS